MLFAVICWDRPNVGELRERTRHSHLDYLKVHTGTIRIGGPFESTEGAIVGTLFIIDVAGEAEAKAFVEEEPFHKAGVFESVRLRRWRQMQPEVSPGADDIVDQAAEVRLKQERI